MVSKVGWSMEEEIQEYRELYEKVEEAVILLKASQELKAFLYLDPLQQEHFKVTIHDLESFLSVIDEASTVEIDQSPV